MQFAIVIFWFFRVRLTGSNKVLPVEQCSSDVVHMSKEQKSTVLERLTSNIKAYMLRSSFLHCYLFIYLFIYTLSIVDIN